ncbi:MAG: hypothetical protein WDN06_11915 [Asticcacaulis sp.]
MRRLTNVAAACPVANGGASAWRAPSLKDAPLLLLDEPTADLDAGSASALIALLPAIFAGPHRHSVEP